MIILKRLLKYFDPCVFVSQSNYETPGEPSPHIPILHPGALFIMRLLKASCHLDEGPAASSDKWIIDGIHPGARLGQ